MTSYDTEIKSQNLDLDMQGLTEFVFCILFFFSLLELFLLLMNPSEFLTPSRFVTFGDFVILFFSEP